VTQRSATLAVLACIFGGTLLSSCSNIAGKSPDAVWVKQPMISFRSPQSTAEKACGQYGKTAVQETVMSDPDSRERTSSPPSGHFVPIHVFRCK
jgi:hypothetical protein